MDEETIEMFKNMLEVQLSELSRNLKVTVNGLLRQENFYSDQADPLDRASTDMNQSFMLRIRDRESRLIGKIKEALERIDDGSFGICESCEEDIAVKRLMARPVATHCIQCKKESEIMEKQFINNRRR